MKVITRPASVWKMLPLAGKSLVKCHRGHLYEVSSGPPVPGALVPILERCRCGHQGQRVTDSTLLTAWLLGGVSAALNAMAHLVGDE